MRRVLICAAVALIGAASAASAWPNPWTFESGGTVTTLSGVIGGSNIFLACDNCLNMAGGGGIVVADNNGTILAANPLPSGIGAIAAACSDDPYGQTWSLVSANAYSSWNVFSGAVTSPYAGYAPVAGSRCQNTGEAVVALQSTQCNGTCAGKPSCTALQQPPCATLTCATPCTRQPLATSFVTGNQAPVNAAPVPTAAFAFSPTAGSTLAAAGTKILSGISGQLLTSVTGQIVSILAGNNSLTYVLQQAAGVFNLTCLDAQSGTVMWNSMLSDVAVPAGDLVISQNVVVVVSERMQGFDATVGVPLWSLPWLGTLSGPVVDPWMSTIVVAIEGTGILAVSPYDGSKLWFHAASVSATVVPVMQSGYVIAVIQGATGIVGIPFIAPAPVKKPDRNVTKKVFGNFNCTSSAIDEVHYQTGCHGYFAVSSYVSCLTAATGDTQVIVEHFGKQNCVGLPTSSATYTLNQCTATTEESFEYTGCN